MSRIMAARKRVTGLLISEARQRPCGPWEQPATSLISRRSMGIVRAVSTPRPARVGLRRACLAPLSMETRLLLRPLSRKGPPAGADATSILQLVPFVLIFVIMWFLIIRPQQRRVKEHQEMIKNVRRGDTVVTSGGIIGKVTKVARGCGRHRGRDRRRREGEGRPRHDLRGAHQGRAGQGLTPAAADRKVEPSMLRFSTSKVIVAIVAII